MLVLPGLDLLTGLLVLCSGCRGVPEELIQSLPVTADEAVPHAAVSFDAGVSTDYNGSFRIEGPANIDLYDLDQLEIAPTARGYLAYRANIRTEDLDGEAYLKLAVPDDPSSEAVSFTKASGTSSWSAHEVSVFTPPGNAPDRVKLHLVVEGEGTVWIDHIRVVWVGYMHE